MMRLPAVAGQFYPGQPAALQAQLHQYCNPPTNGKKVPGVISPHAGYIYSGAIAGQLFSKIAIPDKVVVLGPNHHGLGHSGAVFSEGSWQTPLGEIQIDAKLAADILSACPHFAADEQAHRREHSLEVQVPFIQFCNPRAAIVPICLGHLPLEVLIESGEALAGVIAADEQPVLIIASSDMTHFESAAAAKKKDSLALEKVEELDAEGLYQTVRDNRISMCGVLPSVVMLAAARKLGATSGTVISYATSGDVTGDNSDVVGYAGVIVS